MVLFPIKMTGFARQKFKCRVRAIVPKEDVRRASRTQKK